MFERSFPVWRHLVVEIPVEGSFDALRSGAFIRSRR